MVPKLIVTKKFDSLLESSLLEFDFKRANKRREIEVIKESNDVVWSFTYIYYNDFDSKENKTMARIEPYVSIYNKEHSKLLHEILDDEQETNPITFLLTVQISGIIQYLSGETKGVYSPQNKIRIMDREDWTNIDEDILGITKETIEQFEKYALPFYSRFDSLDNILPELGRDVKYMSLYASGITSRILNYLIVLKLLDRPNVRQIAETNKELFERKDILSSHRKGYKSFCEKYL